MPMYGADTAELRKLAKKFGATAQSLESVRATINSRLGGPLSWHGNDADQFTQLWRHEIGQQLTFAAGRLNQAAADLQRNALEQDVASEVVCAEPPGLSPEGKWLRDRMVSTAVGFIPLPGRLAPLNPLSMSLTVAQGFVDATIPLSEADQNGAMDVGAQRMFGKNVSELTPEQTAALSRRYTDNPVTGVAHMISDQMDNTANKVKKAVGEFFGGLFGR